MSSIQTLSTRKYVWLVECPLFSQSYLINLPDWSTLDIAPRVNWVKFGPIWLKNEVVPRFRSIAQFFHGLRTSNGRFAPQFAVWSFLAREKIERYFRDLALPQFWPKLTHIWPSWPLGQCLKLANRAGWSDNFAWIVGTLTSTQTIYRQQQFGGTFINWIIFINLLLCFKRASLYAIMCNCTNCVSNWENPQNLLERFHRNTIRHTHIDITPSQS